MSTTFLPSYRKRQTVVGLIGMLAILNNAQSPAEGGERKLMILRVRPTHTRFPTSIIFTPVDGTSLHSLPSVMPEGQVRIVTYCVARRRANEISLTP